MSQMMPMQCLHKAWFPYLDNIVASVMLLGTVGHFFTENFTLRPFGCESFYLEPF